MLVTELPLHGCRRGEAKLGEAGRLLLASLVNRVEPPQSKLNTCY